MNKSVKITLLVVIIVVIVLAVLLSMPQTAGIATS